MAVQLHVSTQVKKWFQGNLEKDVKSLEELHHCCLHAVCSVSGVSYVLYFLPLGVYTPEHTGQSEINVMSLGNTQEMIYFIVLSPADNCFATVPQMRKL